MNATLKGYLQLCRPPNLPTAAADIIAGSALAGIFIEDGIIPIDALLVLVLASVLLYAGGVVLNDVFDASLDAVERPERPIPSGVIPKKKAAFFGIVLLLSGIICAILVNHTSGTVAVGLALSILSYDAFSKNYALLGPLNMGVCRGLNLLLGISIVGAFVQLEYLIVPIVFIAAITTVSRGEVHGNNKKNLVLAGFLYALVLFFVIYFHTNHMKPFLPYLVFLALFAAMVLAPLVKAYQKNTPENIKKAVISGVLGIVILDAAIAVAYSNWMIGILILLLLPLSKLLAKLFAVT